MFNRLKNAKFVCNHRDVIDYLPLTSDRWEAPIINLHRKVQNFTLEFEWESTCLTSLSLSFTSVKHRLGICASHSEFFRESRELMYGEHSNLYRLESQWEPWAEPLRHVSSAATPSSFTLAVLTSNTVSCHSLINYSQLSL